MEIKNVTVVGAGILGSQIAMVAAAAGYKVSTYDTVQGALGKSLTVIKNFLLAKDHRPAVPFDKWEGLLAGIKQATDLKSAVAQADMVIEAVNENLELKKVVFADLGRLAPAGAILATNSSSLPVSRVENESGRPELCLNLHFARPLEGVNHVDLMGGSRTRPEIMEIGDAFLRSLGCLPLRVNKEVLGFCFNRVWRAVKKEVLHMWADGVADFRDIDRGWMVFTSMDLGPFGMMDNVGLDVVRDIEMSYYNHSQDPGDRPPRALDEMIERGELGVKAGRGFYTYPDPEYHDPGFLDPRKKD